MSSMTEKMANSSAPGTTVPKKGDHFRCQKCGMEMEITTACTCKDPAHVQFRCCGQEMSKI
jgi:hypothetical protein